MKKSWLACLLAPCLTFAAYPNYERGFDSSELQDTQIAEEFETAHVDQQRTLVGQRGSASYDEENGAYDYDFESLEIPTIQRT